MIFLVKIGNIMSFPIIFFVKSQKGSNFLIQNDNLMTLDCHYKPNSIYIRNNFHSIGILKHTKEPFQHQLKLEYSSISSEMQQVCSHNYSWIWNESAAILMSLFFSKDGQWLQLFLVFSPVSTIILSTAHNRSMLVQNRDNNNIESAGQLTATCSHATNCCLPKEAHVPF